MMSLFIYIFASSEVFSEVDSWESDYHYNTCILIMLFLFGVNCKPNRACQGSKLDVQLEGVQSLHHPWVTVGTIRSREGSF